MLAWGGCESRLGLAVSGLWVVLSRVVWIRGEESACMCDRGSSGSSSCAEQTASSSSRLSPRPSPLGPDALLSKALAASDPPISPHASQHILLSPQPPTPKVRTSRRPPSTYRTAGQRAKDLAAALVNAVILTIRFCLSVPGKLWALRLKTREQWAADWASAKKTIKHEAQHYWVG